MKKLKLHVSGTHCKACKILIEDTLRESADVKSATVDLDQKTVTIETASEKKNSKLVSRWSKMIEPNGYSVSLEKKAVKKDFQTLTKAIPLGIALLFLFFYLQKSGILNVGFGETFTPTTAFFIGIVASLSSCLAIVGGLVLSLSAKISQQKSSWKPFALFHAGRIISFALLGGLLGFVGSTVAINHIISSLLGVLVSAIMILLGINLLDIFDFATRLQPTLGRNVFDRFTRVEQGFAAPILVGIGTFFLPCGFTQSMQLAAISSASVIEGFLIMLLFSLGTFPVLLALSFGSVRFSSSPYASLFFKTAGTVVIGLGVFSLLSGLAGLGIIRPLFHL